MASAQHNLSFGEHLIAGGGAGIAEILVMYPTDVLKTRFQLRLGAERPNLMATVRTMLNEHGVSIFYRGIIAPICSEAPKRAVKFSTNELYRKVFAKRDGSLTFGRYFAAGSCAGMTEAIVNCPFEVVKVRMQAPESLKLYKNTLDCLLNMMRNEGFFALYRGFEPQLWRNFWWNGTYFAVSPILKDKMSGLPLGKWNNFVSGVIAGGLATCLNTPLDVVKSRMQNQRLGEGKYRWTYPSLVTLFTEEGLGACYKGLGMRLLRLGPGGGIMLVAFDTISEWLQRMKHARHASTR